LEYRAGINTRKTKHKSESKNTANSVHSMANLRTHFKVVLVSDIIDLWLQ